MAYYDSCSDLKTDMSSNVSIASTIPDEDWKDNFTAIGGPMPQYKPSLWENICLWGLQAPQYPPFRFTDDSIIPVVVRFSPLDMECKKDSVMLYVCSRRRLNMSLTCLSQRFSNIKGGLWEAVRHYLASFRCLDIGIKIVKMPRREYLQNFARDADGNYVGTKPERCWTEHELNTEYGKYQSVPARMWMVKECEGLIYMEEDRRS